MRLDKCLVEMGLGSRTEVKRLLKSNKFWSTEKLSHQRKYK